MGPRAIPGLKHTTAQGLHELLEARLLRLRGVPPVALYLGIHIGLLWHLPRQIVRAVLKLSLRRARWSRHVLKAPRQSAGTLWDQTSLHVWSIARLAHPLLHR